MTPQANQTDRDLLIRVDADLKNLDKTVKEVRDKQTSADNTSAELTKNVNQLTFNIGALVDGMKDAKSVTTMLVDAHTKADRRMDLLDVEMKELKEDRMRFMKRIDAELGEMKDMLTSSREKWEPVATFFSHWKWMVGGGVAIFGILGWPTILKLIQLIASHS